MHVYVLKPLKSLFCSHRGVRRSPRAAAAHHKRANILCKPSTHRWRRRCMHTNLTKVTNSFDVNKEAKVNEVERLHRNVYRVEPQTTLSMVSKAAIIRIPTGEYFAVSNSTDWTEVESHLEVSGRLHLYGAQFLTLLPKDILDVPQIIKSYLEWITSRAMREKSDSYGSWDHTTAWRIETAWYLTEGADTELSGLLKKSLRIDLEWVLEPGRIRLNNHGLFIVRALLFSLPHLTGDFFDLNDRVSKAVRSRLIQILDLVYGNDNWCGENSPIYDRVWINLLTPMMNDYSEQLDQLGVKTYIASVLTESDIFSRAQLLPNGRYVPRGDTARQNTRLTPVAGTHWSERVGVWTYSHGDLYLMGTAGMVTFTHKHVDETQVYLHWRGIDFFIDGGMHSYNYEDPRIPALRTQIAHSALDADELPALPPWKAYTTNPPRVTGQLTNASNDSVTLSKVFDGITFERTVHVDIDNNTIKYFDSAESLKPIRLVSRFLLPGNAEVRNIGASVDIFRLGRRIRLNLPTEVEVRLVGAEHVPPYRGWYSTRVREIIPGKVLELRPVKACTAPEAHFSVYLDPNDAPASSI